MNYSEGIFQDPPPSAPCIVILGSLGWEGGGSSNQPSPSQSSAPLNQVMQCTCSYTDIRTKFLNSVSAPALTRHSTILAQSTVIAW